MRLLKNMGSLGGVLKLIPGLGKLSGTDIEKGEKELKRTEAMINSMTTEERANPDLLAKSPNRRRRIAKGSGHPETEVTKLIANFTRMRSMMQQMGRGQMPAMPGMPGMGGGMFGGGNQPGFRGKVAARKNRRKSRKRKVLAIYRG